jgi:hypothetical protein
VVPEDRIHPVVPFDDIHTVLPVEGVIARTTVTRNFP